MSSLRSLVAVLVLVSAALAQSGEMSSSPVSAQIETLINFDGTDGSRPYAALVQGFDGALYGTTEKGGPAGYGDVIKITEKGVITLHHFCSVANCADGAYPIAALTRATDGKLYGAAQTGGINDGGTVFSITESGELITLYSFCAQSNCTDGDNPSSVVQAADGNFYGTTFSGGAENEGTVFRVTPQGVLSTLYSFCSQGNSCPDGSGPGAGLVQGADGEFYGTTESGGANTFGTIYKITALGKLTTLHNFDSQDGIGSTAALIQARNGSFYGTSEVGGPHAGGTVYKMTPAGTLTILYEFCAQGSPCLDGSSPLGSLVQASDGNFYGTTLNGGMNDVGTVFSLTGAGKLTTLSFPTYGGNYPYAGFVQATDGTLYGTTYVGGNFGDGTLYRLTTSLPPFVEMEPTSGSDGSQVEILGQGFTDASVVKFGGVQATSVQLQGTTELIATVPPGAISGAVTVTTGSTTLTSTQPFRVVEK